MFVVIQLGLSTLLPPRGSVSTTSFGGGGGGGSYKITAFIHDAFYSRELGVDKSEGLEVSKCLSPWDGRLTLQPSHI